MIRQVINVDNHWRVIVYYNVNYALFDYIKEELVSLGSPVEEIDKLYDTMSSFRAKAATYIIPKHKTSIVLFNKHKSNIDYLNSIAHECYHVVDGILDYYNYSMRGEPPAYTIGFLFKEMFKVFDSAVS